MPPETNDMNKLARDVASLAKRGQHWTSWLGHEKVLPNRMKSNVQALT
jgi:hypothetical protein